MIGSGVRDEECDADNNSAPFVDDTELRQDIRVGEGKDRGGGGIQGADGKERVFLQVGIGSSELSSSLVDNIKVIWRKA